MYFKRDIKSTTGIEPGTLKLIYLNEHMWMCQPLTFCEIYKKILVVTATNHVLIFPYIFCMGENWFGTDFIQRNGRDVFRYSVFHKTSYTSEKLLKK